MKRCWCTNWRIRRHDYLVNMLQGAAEALLFYHPAVWWVSGQIRAERELCCDDMAVAVSGDPLTYARALVEFEACRRTHLAAGVAANGGSLAERIARVLGQAQPRSRSGAGVVASAALLLVAAYGVLGQTAGRPAFQVASIKLNTGANPRGRIILPMAGGRLTSENAPLVMLIQNAYSVQAFQVVGGPAWINTAGVRHRCQAGGSHRSEADVSDAPNAARRPLQTDAASPRREAPVYAVTVAKAG